MLHSELSQRRGRTEVFGLDSGKEERAVIFVRDGLREYRFISIRELTLRLKIEHQPFSRESRQLVKVILTAHETVRTSKF
jgi:hypothetical protein